MASLQLLTMEKWLQFRIAYFRLMVEKVALEQFSPSTPLFHQYSINPPIFCICGGETSFLEWLQHVAGVFSQANSYTEACLDMFEFVFMS